MSQKNETKVLILSLLVTAALLGIGFWWFTRQTGVNLDSFSGSKPSQSDLDNTSGSPESRMSLGDKILVTADKLSRL